MNFSTVPPWCSSAALVASKKRVTTPRTDSGSSRSPSPVEPDRSQKTTVTTLRSSCCAGVASSRTEPQAGQKRAPAGAPWPHLGHGRTKEVYGWRRGGRTAACQRRAGQRPDDQRRLRDPLRPRLHGRARPPRRRPPPLAPSRPHRARPRRPADRRGPRLGQRHLRQRPAHRRRVHARPRRPGPRGRHGLPGHRRRRQRAGQDAAVRLAAAARGGAGRPARSAPPAPAEELLVTGGLSQGKRLGLGDEVVLGRAPTENGGLGEDPGLSRRHARVARDTAGGIVIEDLGSANGTFVNGQRIGEPRALSVGDSVRVGQTTLEVVEQGQDASPAAAAGPPTVASPAAQPQPPPPHGAAPAAAVAAVPGTAGRGPDPRPAAAAGRRAPGSPILRGPLHRLRARSPRARRPSRPPRPRRLSRRRRKSRRAATCSRPSASSAWSSCSS